MAKIKSISNTRLFVIIILLLLALSLLWPSEPDTPTLRAAPAKGGMPLDLNSIAALALNDIGAIAYFSERPVVDLAGLITPEVVPLLRSPDRDALLVDFMAGWGVEYVIILPNWFPGLAARDDVLEEVHRVTLERNTIAGGETMVVYRADW